MRSKPVYKIGYWHYKIFTAKGDVTINNCSEENMEILEESINHCIDDIINLVTTMSMSKKQADMHHNTNHH